MRARQSWNLKFWLALRSERSEVKLAFASCQQQTFGYKELYESIYPGRTITRNCHL